MRDKCFLLSVTYLFTLFIPLAMRTFYVLYLVKHGTLFFLFVCLFIYLFIYLFLAVLGLLFCVRAFSSCSKWGPLFITVHGPLTIAASPVAEHRLQTCRLSSCGSRA